MTLKKAALAKNSANNFLWINIVFCVRIQDTCLFYASVQLLIRLKQMITDVECCVFKVRQYIIKVPEPSLPSALDLYFMVH